MYIHPDYPLSGDPGPAMTPDPITGLYPDGTTSFASQRRDAARSDDSPDPARPSGDVVTFSDEAVRAFRENAIEPIKNGTFTLKGLESRINTVRAEIVQVWNSALPDDEKYRQISARENEISLLQAGQFAFARAGFSMTA